MQFDSEIIAHRAPIMHKKRVAKRSGCSNGLYISPAASAKVDSSKPMTISWDNTCFNPAPSTVDIYMTAPYNTKTSVYTWYDVDYALGTYSVNLMPKWWNSTNSVTLQLNIVQSGTPSFLTQFPAGPVFDATYDPTTAATNSQVAAAANTAIPDSPYTTVNNIFHGGGLSKGQLGAVVLIPLLLVFTSIAVYVKITRAKEAKKRQRWSQAVDKRMSTISTDWKSMSGAAANHAIRQSMALSAGDRGTRTSSFFAGNGPSLGRPSSSFTTNTEPGQAGVGSRYNGVGLGGNLAASELDMTQIRRPPGIANNPVARISRISFADNVHPRHSTADGLRTSVYTTGSGPSSRASRAYHRGTVYGDEQEVPPLPNMKTDDLDMQLSPTQQDGPKPLTADEIRAKIGASDMGRPSVDELLRMPAMSLMRTSEQSPDFVLRPVSVEYPVLPSPEPVAPAPLPVSTPISSNFSGMKPLHETASGTMMSPDDMLRAYALSKKTSVVSKKKSKTIETTTIPNGGMRTLYAPPDTSSASISTSPASIGHSNEEIHHEEESYSYGYSSYYGGSHEHSDSIGTEEGVVTYGRRARAVSGIEVGSNNPFRKSMKVVSEVYEDDDIDFSGPHAR